MGHTALNRLEVAVLAEVVAVGLGVLFLSAFFRAIGMQWPENYFSVARDIDSEISASPIRYASFRFGPVVLTSAFIGSVLYRAGESVFLPTLALGAIHASLSSGLAGVRLLRTGRLKSRPLLGVFYCAVFGGCVMAALLGGALVPAVAEYVPSGAELSVALWTGVFAGVTGILVLNLTRSRRLESQDDAFERSLSAIGVDLWRVAADEAMLSDSDPRLVHAVMIVENIQRPGWIRRLEDLGVRLFGQATVGLLQVDGAATVDDESSIRTAIRTRFAGQRQPQLRSNYSDARYADTRWLTLFLHSYNPDPHWMDDVQSAYSWLEYRQSDAIAATEDRAPDGLPTIELQRARQADSRLTLTGTASVYEGNVMVVQRDGQGNRLRIDTTTASLGGPDRGVWSIELTLEAGAARVDVTHEVCDMEDPLPEHAIMVPIIPRA